MADNVTRPVKSLNFKGPNTSNVPTGGSSRSPRSAAESKPCQHSKGGRNLVVCIDGTANQFGEKNTNVIELYNLILKEVEDNQRTWYNSGIGTYARPSWKSLRYYGQVVYHMVDLAIAWGFEQTVLAAYRWLSDNYERGDCIFLFGFSRGAYQVRVLSAMIDKVGLIYKGNEMQIPFAYELYRDPKSDGPSGVHTVGSPDMTSSAERFKKAFSIKDVRVHFVGAWDTVSSIGIVRGKRMLPRTIDGMKHVCYFRHALALDERRVKFLPEYAYGGEAKPPANSETNIPSPCSWWAKHFHFRKGLMKDTSPLGNMQPTTIGGIVDDFQAEKPPTEDPPQTLEVWFAGTHSDIGGGNAENSGMNRSRPPLRWMVFEAGALGLRTVPFERTLLPEEQIDIRESLTWVWWPLELLFFNRLTYTRREQGKQTTHKPHLGSSRKIHAGQKIHGSLMLSNKMSKDYIPKARPLGDDPSFWAKAHAEGLGDWLAADLYEFAQTVVEKFLNEMDNTALQTLRQTATWTDGRQAVYDGVIGGLRSTETATETKYQLLKSTVDIIPKSGPALKLCHSNEIQNLISDLRESNNEDYQEIVRQFVGHFTDHGPLVLNGHISAVNFVAFSPDSRYIVSGSADSTAQIWDAETGRPVGARLQGHTGVVSSVVFSPDGTRIVSGSTDGTIQLWTGEMGKLAGEVFGRDLGWITSVAFSADGKYIVCGVDSTIQIWDAETRKKMGDPLQGHTDRVLSVAFSPDGRRIVSGSYDRTVRLWDAETRKPIGHSLQGHTNIVGCVAFSPDGKHIFSSSVDTTVRIWDMETGKPAEVRALGSQVYSIAFSPDGKHLASASEDGVVGLWDVETGKRVGRFEGYSQPVFSVVFSPDGTRIASGSGDHTIRIWDVTGKLVGEPIQGHTREIDSVTSSPTSKSTRSVANDQSVQISDAGSTDGQLVLHGHTNRIQSIAISADGRRIVSGSADLTVRIWDAETGKPMGRPFRGHENTVYSVAFSHDSTRVVSGSGDSTIRIWDVEGGKLVRDLFAGVQESAAGRSVASVAFSPDGKHVASGSTDLQLWGVETGKTVGEPFLGHTNWVYSVAFSPDGRHLVSGSGDNTIWIWDVETRKPVGEPLRGHMNWVISVAFSPDGACIVSGSWDQTLRIWNVETGRQVGQPFHGHTNHVRAVAFSPDGMRVASGSEDSTIRIWDVKTGELVGEPFRGHSTSVTSVAFSPDGKRVISSSLDHTIRIWDVESQEKKAPVQA